MRVIAILLLASLGGTMDLNAVPVPTDSKAVPWQEGETLTYQIDWGLLRAAEGTFVVHTTGDAWQFSLNLQSLDAISLIYPFNDTFSSLTSKQPWRSLNYTEDRKEPNRQVLDVTTVDYVKKSLHRVKIEKIKKTTEVHDFKTEQSALDDLGSMLYHLRLGKWNPGDKRTLYVYEDNSDKEGKVECLSREERAFTIWPRQSMLKIVAKPGKGTKRKGGLVIWMTDDAQHIPLHADLIFVYGTFSMDLIKVEKANLTPMPITAPTITK